MQRFRDLGRRGARSVRGGRHGPRRPLTTERTFEHARAVYDAMTPDSQQRVLDRVDDMLAMYYDEDVRKLFTRAVDIEFSTIERRMLLKKKPQGTA